MITTSDHLDRSHKSLKGLEEVESNPCSQAGLDHLLTQRLRQLPRTLYKCDPDIAPDAVRTPTQKSLAEHPGNCSPLFPWI